ncbi:MAG: AAA family ATPase [Magnetococcales bacterium]|nr:AAA family ATPase [Magnetococcales bacterium]
MQSVVNTERELQAAPGADPPAHPPSPPGYAPPPPEDEGEKGIPLLYYWQVVLKRKWQVMAIIFLVVLPTAIHVSSMVPLFSASTTMLIEQKKNKVISIEEIYGVDTGSQTYLQTQFELMKSRHLVEEVVRQERLDLAPEFNPSLQKKRRGWTWKQWIPPWLMAYLPQPKAIPQIKNEFNPERFRSLVDAVTGRISVAPVRNSQLVRVSFVSEDPEIASRVATTVAQTYIDQKLEARLQMTQHAAGWLMQRLEGLRTSLEESERELQRYREQTGLVGSQEKESMEAQQLSAINVRWLQAQARRTEVEIRYDRLQALLKEYQGQLGDLPLDDNQLVVSLRKEANKVSLRLTDLAGRYGEKHPKIIRSKAELVEIKQKIAEEVSRSVATMKHDYSVAKLQEKKAAQQLNAQKMRLQSYQKKAFHLANLEREVATNRELYDMFLKRFKETGVSEGMEPDNARIVDPAQTPRGSFAPNKRRIVTLAGMAGLVLGVFLALMLEYMDRTIRDPAELEQMSGLPILATLPKLSSTIGKALPPPEGMMSSQPRSPYAEAIRSIRTSILFSNVDTPPKVVMVTSTVPSEGKTTVAVNLAQAFHQSGDRTLLMEADLRKPRFNQFFNVGSTGGITNLLVGQDTFGGGIGSDIFAGLGKELQSSNERMMIQKEIVSTVEGLHILPCQEILPFPSEVLASRKWTRIMEILREDYDRIVIDCPPVLAVTDARIVGAQADGVVFVVSAGKAHRDMVLEAVRQLYRSSARVLGLVMNNVDMKEVSYYRGGKGYGYGYGSTYGYG